MKVSLSKTDPILATARIGTAEKPYELVVTYDDYSETFVLLSCPYDDNPPQYDLVWKGDINAVMRNFEEIVGDALQEQFGPGSK